MKNPDRTPLQQWIDKKRADRYTFELIASDFGVDKSTIHHWSTGRRKPGINRLRHVMKITGLPVGKLLK